MVQCVDEWQMRLDNVFTPFGGVLFSLVVTASRIDSSSVAVSVSAWLVEGRAEWPLSSLA